jgi:hypothetical protein
MKDKKIHKGIYFTEAQINKIEKIRQMFSKKAKVNFSFSATVAKIIEERK